MLQEQAIASVLESRHRACFARRMTRRRRPLSLFLRGALLQVWVLATLAVGISACAPDAPGDRSDLGEATTQAQPSLAEMNALLQKAAPAVAAGYALEVIGSDALVSDGRVWWTALIRITRPDGGRTYAAWIPSDKPGDHPLVVATNPYDGTPWSGEALDARWAGYRPLPSGLYLDVDGPGFDGSSAITYVAKTGQQVISENFVHLWNDLSVLVVFGRFYAGGSVRDDVADMAAGMWLAAELPWVDRARIGTYGGSWGGFEALFAAQQADPRARPRVVSALYPPSDLADCLTNARTRTGAALTALHPHVRRITAGTGGPPEQPGSNYGGLRVGDLCAFLPETLTLHDELDNLVPVRESQTLAATCGTEALYWPRAAAVDPSVPDHGPLLTEPDFPSVLTYSLTYLHLRLMPPAQQALVEVYSRAALRIHLRLIHDAQLAGRDIGYVIPRLYDLMDPRVYLFDLSTCGAPAGCTVERGVDVVAQLIEELWGPLAAASAPVRAEVGARVPPSSRLGVAARASNLAAAWARESSTVWP
jgi:hypothetical protein